MQRRALRVLSSSTRISYRSATVAASAGSKGVVEFLFIGIQGFSYMPPPPLPPSLSNSSLSGEIFAQLPPPRRSLVVAVLKSVPRTHPVRFHYLSV